MRIGNTRLTQWQNSCVLAGIALSFLAVIVYFKTAEGAKEEKPPIRQILEVPKIEIAKAYSIDQLLKKARPASADSVSISLSGDAQNESLSSEAPRKRSRSGKINLNTADYDMLMQVPGMRGEIAKSILEYRKKMGEIWELDELKDLPGVNDSFLDGIKRKVTLE
ncbi:MAG: helix-hairpin-helix domain-containing protein [bacterium]